MGLLGDIFSAGNTAKRRLRGLLDDPIGSMQQAVDNAFPTRYEAQNAISQLRGQQYNPDALQAYNTKLDSAAMNFAPMGLTVWHGSPHKFNKFDMSKIGTGEGAQAYGHGLYMAESPDVAKEYANKLSADRRGLLQRAISDSEITRKQRDYIAGALEGKNPWPNNTQGVPAKRETLERHLATYDDLLKSAEPLKSDLADAARLYKVDIPDEAVSRFLDWDKPLSQQAHVMEFINKQEAARTQSVLEKRLQTLANVGEDAPNAAVIKKQIAVLQDELANPQGSGLGSMTGGDYYNYLRRRDIPPQEQAEMFSGAGIPGIRYLDGGSRSAGQGSSNFVLFSDDLPRILEANGVPTGLQPWKPNEWGGLLSP